VRDAVEPVVEAGTDRDDPDWPAMHDRPVPDELVRTKGGERRDRIDEGKIAGLGETRGDADHVLFRHADVEEAVRVLASEGIDDAVAQIAGEQHDAPVQGGEFRQRPDECLSHDSASTAATARAYSASDIGE
jgi:hypothetical protein